MTLTCGYSIASSFGLTTAALAVSAPIRAERSPMRNLVQSKLRFLFSMVLVFGLSGESAENGKLI